MFEVKVTYGREIFNVELDGLTCNSVEDVLEAVVEEYNEQHSADEDFVPLTKLSKKDVTIDMDELPEFLRDWDILEKSLYIIQESSYEVDIFEAAYQLGIDFENVEDSYIGEFGSDEEFAENYVEETGYLSRDFPSWIVIDWRATASYIMDDCMEYNGYYFRNY